MRINYPRQRLDTRETQGAYVWRARARAGIYIVFYFVGNFQEGLIARILHAELQPGMRIIYTILREAVKGFVSPG